MKAGFYETDITPAIGMERPATYYKLFIEKISDPLKARAVYFSDGKKNIALVGVDICKIQAAITQAVREALPGVEVMLSASHTHYGGPVGQFQTPDDKNMPELIKKLIFEESICTDPDYVKHLVSQIVTAVKMAEQRMEEVDLSFGSGNAEGVAFNRRFRMKNGHCATHPGKGNPDIIEPAGPVDPETGVVGVWRKNGEFLGCVVNFTCHGTCDTTGATADWPGQMVNTVKKVMGEDKGVVYLYGAAGDITQINNQSLCPSEVGPEYSKIVGVTVGAEVLKVLMTAPKGPVEILRSESEFIRIPIRKPSKKSLEESFDIVQKWERDTAFHFAKERLILDELIKKSPEDTAEIQLIQLGPLIMACVPGELFCAFGLEFKKLSHFPFSWFCGLANGTIGYVPTQDAFDPATGGGYETRLTAASHNSPEAGGMIMDKITTMLKNFAPGTVPTGPQIKPATEVWKFGNCLPELD